MSRKIFLSLLSVFILTISGCSSSDDSSVNPIPPVEKPEPPTDPDLPPEKPEENNADYIPIEQDQKAYYKQIDFTLRGVALQNALRELVTKTQTTLSYTPGIWEASKITDQDPDNPDNVLLIYGWPKGQEKTISELRSFPKDQRYTNANERWKKWEREHVYAKSRALPKLETTNSTQNPSIAYIAGNDAHNLRPINGLINEERGNKKFGDAQGNSRALANGMWYPGDEWKGDVARMVLYMYLRYDQQCLPTGIASLPLLVDPITGQRDMVQLLLKWNAQDPPSIIEVQRNLYHGNKQNTYAQGNRNPFIDNPHLANLIWGEQINPELIAPSLWDKIEPKQ